MRHQPIHCSFKVARAALCMALVANCTPGSFHAGKSDAGAQSTAYPTLGSGVVASASFACAGGKSIAAEFRRHSISLSLSDGRRIDLPQTISGSGARYADANDSFVFWNKGDGAFIQENGTTTYGECQRQRG